MVFCNMVVGHSGFWYPGDNYICFVGILVCSIGCLTYENLYFDMKFDTF